MKITKLILITVLFVLSTSMVSAVTGDLDNDGLITPVDYNIMRNIILGMDTTTYPNADMNGDGNVTQADLDILGGNLVSLGLLIDGDLDNDGLITPADYNIMRNIILELLNPADYPNADMNGDGIIDQNDLDIVLGNIGIEICDSIDNNRDGIIDSITESTNELGACSINTQTCNLGVWTLNNEYTIALEVCDNIDNNCDGNVDEGLTFSTYFEDLDLDGEGNSLINQTSCNLVLNYVLDNKDCNDNDALINGTASEVNDNLIDENCDGVLGTTPIVSSGGSGGGSGGSHRRPEVVTNKVNPVVNTYEALVEAQNNQGENNNAQANEITGAVTAETGNGNLLIVLLIVGILGIIGLFGWKRYSK